MADRKIHNKMVREAQYASAMRKKVRERLLMRKERAKEEQKDPEKRQVWCARRTWD